MTVGGERDGQVRYETFAHEADIGVRGFGESVEAAFVHVAEAMFAIMIDTARVRPRERRTLSVQAPERDLLLVEWLNGLLALSDMERMVFSRFAVVIRGDTLDGEAWGEQLDRERHRANVEVKGATYHLLHVGKDAGRFVAQCVVDV